MARFFEADAAGVCMAFILCVNQSAVSLGWFWPMARSCSYSYCGYTIAQCVPCLYILYSGLAWPARVMYPLPVFVLVPCVYYCTASTGNVRFTRFVLVPVLWLYHCTVCTVLVPLVQWSGVASAGNVPFTRFCTRAVRVLLHSASTGRVLIGRVRTRTVVVPLHSMYRACTVISPHSSWTSSSLKGSAIPFLGREVELVY